MKRALVLSHEGSRHPFRQTLPREFFAMPLDEAQPELALVELAPLASAPAPRRKMTEDTAFFLTSFIAGFVIIYGFIA